MFYKMKLLFVLNFLIFCAFIVGATKIKTTKSKELRENSTYFLTVPRILFAGSYSTVSISVTKLNEDATITVKLVKDGKEYPSYSKVLLAKSSGIIERMPFYVPKDLRAPVLFKVDCIGGVSFSHNVNDLEVKILKDKLFIQTDKPIYKPGGKVQFRVIGIDKDLKPKFQQPIEEIFITNPSGSRMIQWTNTSLHLGMISLEMPLSIKPVLGEWTITAKSGSITEVQTIVVEKYVLPKFEVTIESPSYILKTAKTVTFKVCGKYTYGKLVVGKLEIKLCLDSPYSWNTWGMRMYYRSSRIERYCLSIKKKINGCENVVYTLNDDMYIIRHHNIRIKVDASITEDATGTMLTSIHFTKQFSSREVSLKFDVPNYYKPGFVYKGKLLVTTPDGRPAIGDKYVTLTIKKRNTTRNTNRKSYYHTYTGEVVVERGTYRVTNGVYEFSVSPLEDASYYSYYAKYETINLHSKRRSKRSSPINRHKQNIQTYGRTNAWYSPTKHYVKITHVSNVDVGNTARIVTKFSKNSRKMKSLNYMVVCKGKIMVASVLKSYDLSAYIRFRVTEKMVPICRILVYYIMKDGEFVSDNYVVKFGASFKNKVSLTFAADEKKPGEDINFVMKASPGSRFAVSAVDKSVLLLGSNNDITEGQLTSVLNEQDVKASTKYERRRCSTKCSSMRRCWTYFNADQKVDGRTSIKETGLKYITNAQVDVTPCLGSDDHRYDYSMPMFRNSNPVRPGIQDDRIQNDENVESARKPNKFNKPVFKKKSPTMKASLPTKVRKEFPETWLWFDEIFNASGEFYLSARVPDTITTWIASGFAISSTDGIGIATPSSIKAFQPFFISLNLPYSVKRGEIVKVPATVFNYLDKCLVIGLTLKQTSDFTAITGLKTKLCVCGGSSKTFKFGIKPNTLGKIDITVEAKSYSSQSAICGANVVATDIMAADALKRKLLVEAEGIKKEYSKSVFFCGMFTGNLSLNLPKKIVPGSVYAELAVTGDLLGPSMDGLDKLLAMPYGCGEQNMLRFAPNIYIMDYLVATNQVTSSIKTKAKKFMISGYQRELTYKHKNGAYSAFGERGGRDGSTWLTAFVLRTYAQARRYIFIDNKDIEDSKKWLFSLQQSNGCFKEVGMVHHKDMKGGVTGGITMTSFVMIALLEADTPHKDQRIQKALKCIEGKLNYVTDYYTASVLAFSLKLAGSSKADIMLNKLKNGAMNDDGGLHWEDNKSNKKKVAESYYYHQAKSADIEMTAYALMANMGGRNPFYSKLEQLSIVKWLVKQRNAYGGFSSTQDTCVGLQALANYAANVFSGSYNLNINVMYSNTNYNIVVDENNKLVLQKHQIDASLPVDIMINATGTGCALAQANVKYNEPEPGIGESFNLHVKVKKDKNSLTCQHKMKVCGSYTGSGKSNMALIDINMVSGFEPVVDKLDIAMQGSNVTYTQYEFLDEVLSFYFDEFEQTSKCVDFTIEQVAQVEGRKPASLTIYDYYNKDDSETKMYSVGECPEMNVVS